MSPLSFREDDQLTHVCLHFLPFTLWLVQKHVRALFFCSDVLRLRRREGHGISGSFLLQEALQEVHTDRPGGHTWLT